MSEYDYENENEYGYEDENNEESAAEDYDDNDAREEEEPESTQDEQQESRWSSWRQRVAQDETEEEAEPQDVDEDGAGVADAAAAGAMSGMMGGMMGGLLSSMFGGLNVGSGQNESYGTRAAADDSANFNPPAGPPPGQYGQYGQQYGEQYGQQYGQQYDQQHGQQYGQQYGQQGQYTPPSGPPPGYGGNGGNGGYGSSNQYTPPSGPPPGHSGQHSGSAGNNKEGEPYFEYSRCNGRRKAVLVGINYFGSKAQLNGCINDVHNVTRFLQGRGYQDITILTDDTNDQNLMPTRANIIRHMQALVAGAQKDDALFFHYSGHGTQAQGGDSTEADGLMEAICPVDYESAGLLHDRESDYDLLVKPLPAGARLTCIFDSCHSGTVMNLPYAYSTQGTVKEPNMLAGGAKGLLRAAPQYLMGDHAGAAKSLFSSLTSTFKEKQADSLLRAQNTSSADVILFSGCKDEQTSADTTEEGQATGAMSYALIKALNKNPNVSYKQLLNEVRAQMKEGGYSQKPQLSACHPMDTDLQFVA